VGADAGQAADDVELGQGGEPACVDSGVGDGASVVCSGSAEPAVSLVLITQPGRAAIHD
jgi:hypothetical protein